MGTDNPEGYAISKDEAEDLWSALHKNLTDLAHYVDAAEAAGIDVEASLANGDLILRDNPDEATTKGDAENNLPHREVKTTEHYYRSHTD